MFIFAAIYKKKTTKNCRKPPELEGIVPFYGGYIDVSGKHKKKVRYNSTDNTNTYYIFTEIIKSGVQTPHIKTGRILKSLMSKN